jgi:hypothetical protein
MNPAAILAEQRSTGLRAQLILGQILPSLRRLLRTAQAHDPRMGALEGDCNNDRAILVFYDKAPLGTVESASGPFDFVDQAEAISDGCVIAREELALQIFNFFARSLHNEKVPHSHSTILTEAYVVRIFNFHRSGLGSRGAIMLVADISYVSVEIIPDRLALSVRSVRRWVAGHERRTGAGH